MKTGPEKWWHHQLPHNCSIFQCVKGEDLYFRSGGMWGDVGSLQDHHFHYISSTSHRERAKSLHAYKTNMLILCIIIQHASRRAKLYNWNYTFGSEINQSEAYHFSLFDLLKRWYCDTPRCGGGRERNIKEYKGFYFKAVFVTSTTNINVWNKNIMNDI